MYSILLLMLATPLATVQCDIGAAAAGPDAVSAAAAIQSQYDANHMNYVQSPVQAFALDDRRPLHAPYGFYGMPINQYLDGNSLQQPHEQHQQQAKVKKDIQGVNSGNSLILDDIR